MTLADDIRPVMEGLRVTLADLGFRRWDVVLRVVDWSGRNPGEGARVAVDTPLTIQGRRVKIRRVTQKEIIASGGRYEDLDIKIGPFTPAYEGKPGPFPSGGINLASLIPPAPSTGSRVFYYRVEGPGYEGGAWFEEIERDVIRNWSLYVVGRRRSTIGDP